MKHHRNSRLNYLLMVGLLAMLSVMEFAVYRAHAAADDLSLDSLPLKHVADIPLPGRPTRFDYANLDTKRNLLYIAHLGDGEVVVFDTQALRVIARIGDVSSAHGVLAIPELSRVYASATGTNEIVAIDATTLKIVARMPGGRYPDGMAYAPDVSKLYVSDEYGETETVIDVRTNRRVATIPLDGEAGNTQYDPISHHVFVNVQTRRQLVEIDPTTDRIVGRFDLPGAKGNHGLLIDPRERLAFIACEGNDKLIIFNMRSKQVTQAFAVGGDPDVLAFDPTLSTLYVAGEDGVVSLFRFKAGVGDKIGEGRLGPNAHVVAIDSATHRSYFPLKGVGGRPMLRVMEPG
ncbi:MULTISPECIES: YncE family protein [unclassified Burkholderia]|uniref:YncE family protein n=2 Tax=Burkholderia TaxID=32008 RepID=UPI0010F99672|nr:MULTISPECIES: YncE family protein [unclassified Burkholderia]